MSQWRCRHGDGNLYRLCLLYTSGLKEGQVINKLLEEYQKKKAREMTDKQLLTPVSYTHLDVYKRQEQEKLHDKNFRFTLTTNGVLLNDEIMEFCNKEMANVVLSVDGRKDVYKRQHPLPCRGIRPML